MTLKILVLGGYGVFGGRLVELLADCAELEMLVAGRDEGRAETFCRDWRGRAAVFPLQLDRRDIAQALAEHRPDLVVDASGPFQQYGEDGYRAVEACIAAGVDYLDFADAAEFVFGVSRFDAAAREAGVFVLSGVSSFPVLTAAVVREIAKTIEPVSIEGGIAPSPYAGIGLNVMRAVVGYAGGPVQLLRGGAQVEAKGLTESLRYTIAVPGRLPLRNIHFSLVDVPDLRVIPPEHPTLRDIWMGAGPVPEALHRVLNLLAKARARFGLPSLVPFSRLFYAVLNRMTFGEHRGGMFVRVRGTPTQGRPAECSWHLLAESDDGPYIPSMAIEAIVRKLMAGERPAPGARPATHALELADYEPVFAGRRIYSGLRPAPDAASPLYRRVLGLAFDGLPSAVQRLHGETGARVWRGTAEVRRGTGSAARAICALLGFPHAGSAVPVLVRLDPAPGGERWTRTFAGRTFSSLQSAGSGRDQYLLVERFGAIAVAMALVVDGDRLRLVPRRWSILGVPLPRFLLPAGQSFETERDGRFVFDVEIALPGIGLVVAYQGVLEPI